MRAKMHLTRELVDLIPSAIEDPGPDTLETELTVDNYHQKTADEILATLAQGDALWVFAFGSLIWKPRFTHTESRHARLDGWQRSFCLGPDKRYRGNPEQPGYMLSLVEGGNCEGVVFRMAEDVIETELLAMIESEPPITPVWVDTETSQGTVRCIAFVCPQRAFEFLGNPTPEEKIKSLATAVGKYGSMPDYVLNTVQCLEDAGIYDPYLWEMQELVAEYLENMG